MSEDRRALLRLLVGGDSYEQVAEVLGKSPSEVRSQAHEAVAELERESGGEDDLAAAARRRLADLDAPGSASGVGKRLPGGRRRSIPLAWLAIAGALGGLLIVLFVVVRGGGDSGGPAQPSSSAEEDVVDVKLEPIGGAAARGTAQLVRVADLPALDLDIKGLEPTRPGQTYVVWLLGSGRQGIPIAFRDVGPDGRLSGRTPVPAAAAGLLPSIEVLDLSLASKGAASAAARRAAESGTLPRQVGKTVLRGALRG